MNRDGTFTGRDLEDSTYITGDKIRREIARVEMYFKPTDYGVVQYLDIMRRRLWEIETEIWWKKQRAIALEEAWAGQEQPKKPENQPAKRKFDLTI